MLGRGRDALLLLGMLALLPCDPRPGVVVDAVFDAVFVFEGFLGFIVTDLKQQLGEFR